MCIRGLWAVYLKWHVISVYIVVFSEAQERLMDVYERLDEMDSEMAIVRAAELLHGMY